MLAANFKMLVFNDGILGAVVYIGAVVVPNPAPNVQILALAGQSLIQDGEIQTPNVKEAGTEC